MAQKVPVQKGPIKCEMPTMKTMKRAEMNAEDAKHDRMRRDGQTLHDMKVKQ